MAAPKVVLIARFEIPAESMLRHGPEHKIQHGFTADGVCCCAVFRGVNPLRTNSHHELRFFRECPWLLKQKVDVPFRGAPGKERWNPRLQFQPVLDWRNFNRDRRAEAR